MPTWLTPPDSGELDFDEPHVVAYSEKEGYSGTEWTASVELQCPWEDRHDVTENILSNLLIWPYRPESQLLASNASVVPWTNQKVLNSPGELLTNDYKLARITVNFTAEPPGNVTPGESPVKYYESIEPNAEMLKVPPTNLVWEAPATDTGYEAVKEEEAPTMIIGGLDYSIRYLGLTSIPAILSLINKTNAAEVVCPTLGVTFAIETLLLNPYKASREVKRTSFGEDGGGKWEMEVRWSWRQNTWNKYWRPDTQAWEPMYIRIVNPFDPEDIFIEEYKQHPPVDMTPAILYLE